MDPKLMQFIDAERFPAVFSTEDSCRRVTCPWSGGATARATSYFQAGERHPFTYHVGSGIVRLYLSSPEGTVKTLFYHAAGTQFAFQGFKRDRMTRSTAVAVTDCELYAVDYADLIAFCDDHTEYYMAYIEYLFSIMNSQTEEIASLSFQTGLRRVAQLLYALTCDGNPEVPYSIDEVAEIVGAHRNTVSNAFSHLRKLGLLEKAPRPVRVRDVEGLRLFVGAADA